MMTDSQRLGAYGEVLAARYLRAEGCTLICGNYRTRAGEIDIAATDGENLIIAEVKTRTAGQMFPPAEAVDAKKRHNLETAAAALSKEIDSDLPLRFDIIEVTIAPGRDAEINHIKNAF